MSNDKDFSKTSSSCPPTILCFCCLPPSLSERIFFFSCCLPMLPWPIIFFLSSFRSSQTHVLLEVFQNLTGSSCLWQQIHYETELELIPVHNHEYDPLLAMPSFALYIYDNAKSIHWCPHNLLLLSRTNIFLVRLVTSTLWANQFLRPYLHR